jgi:hypothetical protein
MSRPRMISERCMAEAAAGLGSAIERRLRNLSKSSARP